MIDLLAAIHLGELTAEEAERIFDETIAKIHLSKMSPDWSREFGLSLYESTAYLHGASLTDLLRLRYNGWPTKCCRCGLPVDYRKFGWWFVHNEDGIPRLRHIVCPTIS